MRHEPSLSLHAFLRSSAVASLLAAAGLFTGVANAVDGVVQINQARALAGGVTASDTPGFPVTIDAPGSYRLTGALAVPADQHGIVFSADEVTLDLNGFAIVSAGGPLLRSGVRIGSQLRAEVRNGLIRGFSQHGVDASGVSSGVRLLDVRSVGHGSRGFSLVGYGSLVDRCEASANGTDGIRVSPGSLVQHSVARGNGGFALRIAGSGYRSNVFTENNGGNANPQVAEQSDAENLGANYCGTDALCP
jgi:hypothetical protein